jgi:hypothetical protein
MSNSHDNGLLSFFVNFARLKVEMNVGHNLEMLERRKDTKKNWVSKTGTQKNQKIAKNRVKFKKMLFARH